MTALVLGGVLVVALNAVPSVLYPSFLTLNLHGMFGLGLIPLIAGHVLTVVMAGLFGFFAVLALRGVLRGVLGEVGFRRSSNATHA